MIASFEGYDNFSNTATTWTRDWNDTSTNYAFHANFSYNANLLWHGGGEDEKVVRYRTGMEMSQKMWRGIAFRRELPHHPRDKRPLVRPQRTLSQAFVRRAAFQWKRKMVRRSSFRL